MRIVLLVVFTCSISLSSAAIAAAADPLPKHIECYGDNGAFPDIVIDEDAAGSYSARETSGEAGLDEYDFKAGTVFETTITSNPLKLQYSGSNGLFTSDPRRTENFSLVFEPNSSPFVTGTYHVLRHDPNEPDFSYTYSLRYCIATSGS